MNLTIFGTGYVGIVTGACFAEMGNDVVCIDIDADKVRSLSQGLLPIHEHGLEALVRSNLAAGRLAFSTDPELGTEHSDVIFIAVGTPGDEDGSADVSHVLAVGRTVGRHMRAPKVVVIKSTVPVGTTDRVRATISEAQSGSGTSIPFDVVSNPEFLKEGAAVGDFMKPDRIIIGAEDTESAKVLELLYAPFNRNHDRIIHMDVRSAELTKYAANVMLATRISQMNELANLADRLGADIEAVRKGVGSDPRIGHSFMYAGAGFGGSCFPKDVRALLNVAREVGYEAEIVRSVEAVNERQKRVLFSKILSHFGGDLAGKTIALWGLAFKPNTDDMREAPSIALVNELVGSGARVQAYDPVAANVAKRVFASLPGVSVCPRADQTLDGADALVVITEWNEFRSPNFDAMASRLRNRVIFDGRNLYDPEYLAAHGFTYYGIGRGPLRARRADPTIKPATGLRGIN